MRDHEAKLEVSQVLGSVEPFKSLPKEYLGLVEKNARLAYPEKDFVIAKENELLQYLGYVISGQLQTFFRAPDGKEVLGQRIVEGRFFGWLATVDDTPMNQSIRTVGSVQLLLLPIELIRTILAADRSFNQFVLKQMAQAIRQLQFQNSILGMQNAYQRIFALLVSFLGENPTQDRLELPKQNEIATIVNTSRETVSRAIQILIKQGVLQKSGHLVKVRQHELLKAAACQGAEVFKAQK